MPSALSECAGERARVGDVERTRAARDGEMGRFSQSSSAPSRNDTSTGSITSAPGEPNRREEVSASCLTAWVISRKVFWRISASSRMAARPASLAVSHSSDCLAKPDSCGEGEGRSAGTSVSMRAGWGGKFQVGHFGDESEQVVKIAVKFGLNVYLQHATVISATDELTRLFIFFFKFWISLSLSAS